MMIKTKTQSIGFVVGLCLVVLSIDYMVSRQIIAVPPEKPISVLERVSVNDAGEGGNDRSVFPAISADGRYVAFYSLASNFVISDTYLSWDVFVFDRHTQTIELASVSSTGERGNDTSTRPDISADGRFVVFPSLASNLVISDTNGNYDVFVHDRQTRETVLVSRSSEGVQGNNGSYEAAISANGQYVAFASFASNLVPGDSNNQADIFVHDRLTGVTERVTVDSQGGQGFGDSLSPYISGDGRFVTFASSSGSLAPGGSNHYHIYVHDRQTRETVRASVNSAGQLANNSNHTPVVSDDGRFVAFGSYATNLFPFPGMVRPQRYVHDLWTGETRLVSISPTGEPGNDYSAILDMTPDGRYIAFGSRASNLVSGDTNGVGDAFVYDRLTGYMLRVSIRPDGEQGNGLSNRPVLSHDGRTVAFYSEANNLVPGDTNNWEDVFVVEWQLHYLWLPVIYYSP